MLIDGIADTHDLYDLATSYQKELVTPPRKGASPFTGLKSRQSHVNLIRALGGDDVAPAIWAKLTGYNERAHVEGTFSTWKRVLDEELSSRSNGNIDSEVYIKLLILNKMNKSKAAR